MKVPLFKYQFKLAFNEKLNEWPYVFKDKRHLENPRTILFGYDFNEGVESIRSGKIPEAIEAFTRAIRINPKHSAAYNNRANCKSFLKQYQDSIIDFTEAIRIDPRYALGYNNRGLSKFHLHQYAEAILDYSEAIRLNPQLDDAYNNRGSSKAELHQFKEAIVDYTEVIRLNPSSSTAYLNRGLCKHHLHQYHESLADYTEAICRNVHSPDAYIRRGNAYFEIGENKIAIEDYCLAIPFSMGLLSSKQNYAPINEVLKFRTVNSNLLNSLKNREIWFAHSRTFNDADDGEYLRKLFPESQSIIDLLKKILIFSCFGNSTSQTSKLHENEKQQMWAHYGSESAGVCLHFNYSPEAAQKGNLFMLDSVKYSDDIKFDENQSQYDVICHGFFTKSTAWKSENEYRFISMASDKTVRSEDGSCIGQLVNEIDLGLTLSAVEFGARCSADDILKVKEALMQRGDGAGIKLYQVKLGTADDPFRWSKEQLFY
jgi:hypothetical protein